MKEGQKFWTREELVLAIRGHSKNNPPKYHQPSKRVGGVS